MNKTAVDAATKEYWSTYFKDYGKAWVRDIPRRVKQAIRRSFKVGMVEGKVVPMAHDMSENGTLSIEAGFAGKIDSQDARVLITATFNPDGRMEDFDITRIS